MLGGVSEVRSYQHKLRVLDWALRLLSVVLWKGMRDTRGQHVNQKRQHCEAEAMHWVGLQPSAPLAQWLERWSYEP